MSTSRPFWFKVFVTSQLFASLEVEVYLGGRELPTLEAGVEETCVSYLGSAARQESCKMHICFCLECWLW